MSVEITYFDSLPSGEKIEKITMSNKNGLSLSVLTYGATISNVVFDGVDVVLGYDDMVGYINGRNYIGGTIGRYANRIKNGTFTLNGRKYHVGCNEREGVHLHGGLKAFDKMIWDYTVLRKSKNPAVKFTYFSKDGEMGYPGNLTMNVTFSVTEDDAYYIEYEAVSDEDTFVNFTNHAYFNLNGYNGENILNNTLEIPADYITELDTDLIPTGEYMPVKDTPLDFNKAKPIGRDTEVVHPQMVPGGGYDINYVLGQTVEMRQAAVAYSPTTGIKLTCLTDQPGLQIYTSGGLNDITGKDGKPMGKYQGFCLETQHFPDSPNNEHFPSTLLKAGETFKSATIFQFSK